MPRTQFFMSWHHSESTFHLSANVYRENKQVVIMSVFAAGTFYFILSPRLNIYLLWGFLFDWFTLFTDRRLQPTIIYVFGHPDIGKLTSTLLFCTKEHFRNHPDCFRPFLVLFLCSENMLIFATKMCTHAITPQIYKLDGFRMLWSQDFNNLTWSSRRRIYHYTPADQRQWPSDHRPVQGAQSHLHYSLV